MDFVHDDCHSSPINSAPVRPTSIHNDQGVHGLREAAMPQSLRILSAPPPSPQDASLLDTIFASKQQRRSASRTCSIQAGNDTTEEPPQPQPQQQMSSPANAMQQHATLLNRLLQQAASSSSSSSSYAAESRMRQRHRLNQSASAASSRRHVASTAYPPHRFRRASGNSGHVHKPSKIPIITSRLRTRAALHKATNELADAIATVHLSSPRQRQDDNANDGMTEG